jgi:hypothetical protein
MPLIQFDRKKDEGAYLLVTTGQVGWFPDGVFGVTEQLLEQLEPRFRKERIRYQRVRPDRTTGSVQGEP